MVKALPKAGNKSVRISEVLPSYKKPPVNEVCIGIQFSDIELELRHIEPIHKAIGKKKYPNISTKDNMGKMNAPPGVHLQLQTEHKLPRIWFEEKDHVGLIQLQYDRLHYNWRKNEALNNSYVRYPTVWDNFQSAFLSLEKVMKKELKTNLRLEMLELIYVNIIPYDETKNKPKLSEIFVDLEWEVKQHSFLAMPNRIDLSLQFPVADSKSYLQAKIRQAVNSQTGQSAYYFELIMRGGNPEGKIEEIKNWYHEAHKTIVKGFTEMTTAKMHKVWERIV